MNDIRIICGRNITKYRKKLGLSQRQLAKKVGISNASIGFYETFVTLPRAECLMWLAEALQIQPYQLLMENGD